MLINIVLKILINFWSSFNECNQQYIHSMVVSTLLQTLPKIFNMQVFDVKFKIKAQLW